MLKKIILFIPSIERGGVEKNLFIISKYLIKKNKNVYIVTSNTDYKDSFDKNIKVICPKSNKWINKNRIIKTFISIALLIGSFYNNRVLIISFQSNIVAILISKLFKFKIIIRLNTSIKKYIDGNLVSFFYKFFYNLSDEIIVNSISFKKELKSFLNLNSTLIYNSFQETKINKKLFFFEGFKGLKILNIGRLTDQKDQITLIKSLNLLVKKKIDFRCCIIGAGEKKNYLENYIRDRKLKKFIRLVGYKKNAETYLESSNLFVLTSKFEGLPNVLIEAQSRNIPIISSDCPTGPREILLNGSLGELFKVGDYQKLSKLIIKFKENNRSLLNKSKKAKKNLIRFKLKNNCEKYCKVILKHN